MLIVDVDVVVIITFAQYNTTVLPIFLVVFGCNCGTVEWGELGHWGELGQKISESSPLQLLVKGH